MVLLVSSHLCLLIWRLLVEQSSESILEEGEPNMHLASFLWPEQPVNLEPLGNCVYGDIPRERVENSLHGKVLLVATPCPPVLSPDDLASPGT